MNFREKYDKNKSSILSIKEVDIINRIKKGEYHYDCEFVGSISNGWHEGEDGMYYYVELYGANEASAFAFHTFIIDKYRFCCHEYEDATIKWFYYDEEINRNNVEKPIQVIIELLELVLKPFNFEQYAIDSFDYDVIAESIPYGNPFCLIIDGCVFMIEDDADSYDEQKINDFLKQNNWPEERINNAIKAGYEITEDVYDIVSDLPIVYLDNSNYSNSYRTVE
ncbi:MAG: hypothetical protein SO440_08565 [Prevotella sp.]|nr:hypothetical protein [Prevotella sp.]